MKRENAALRRLTEFATANQRQLAAFAWRSLQGRGLQPRPEDVEDVLSDAYLTAASKLDDPSAVQIENIGAWFYKVVYFHSLRSAGRKGRENWEQLADDLESEDRLLEAMQASAEVEKLLGSLDEREASVLRLLSEGYTSAEAGERLGLTADNVRQIKSRALSRLRSLIQGGPHDW